LGGIASEAVHDARQAGGRPMPPKDTDRIGPSLARVDHNRQTRCRRDFQLLNENRQLHFFRHAPVIIQTNLANGFHFWMSQQAFEIVESGGANFRSIVWVHTNGGVNESVLIHEPNGSCEIGRSITGTYG
jgi:hypothetical protein